MDVNINANVVKSHNSGLVKGLIPAQYKDTCNLCFKDINAGDKVAWYGKGFGVRHFECYLKRDTLLSNEEYDVITDW